MSICRQNEEGTKKKLWVPKLCWRSIGLEMHVNRNKTDVAFTVQRAQ